MHKTLVNNVINYQPQLETRISEPSTVVQSSISPVVFLLAKNALCWKWEKNYPAEKDPTSVGRIFSWQSRNTKPDMLSVLCLLFLLCLMWKSHTSHSAKKDGDCDISFQTPKTPWKFAHLVEVRISFQPKTPWNFRFDQLSRLQNPGKTFHCTDWFLEIFLLAYKIIPIYKKKYIN